MHIDDDCKRLGEKLGAKVTYEQVLDGCYNVMVEKDGVTVETAFVTTTAHIAGASVERFLNALLWRRLWQQRKMTRHTVRVSVEDGISLGEIPRLEVDSTQPLTDEHPPQKTATHSPEIS